MGAIGGGLLVGLAIILWAGILIPALIERRRTLKAELYAGRLQRAMRRLANQAEISAERAIVEEAKQVLQKERKLHAEQQAALAARRADLAQAKAKQRIAELEAKRQMRSQAALVRAEKLRGALPKSLRLVFLAIGVLSLIAAVVGIGLALGGQGAALLVASGGSFIVCLAMLVLLAPGRAAQRAQRARRDARSLRAASAGGGSHSAVVVKQEPATNAANPTLSAAEVARAQARQHAAAQAAAAQRIAEARAKQLARVRRPEVVLENQTDSILLRQAAPKTASKAVAAEATSTPAPVTANTAPTTELKRRLHEVGVIDPRQGGGVNLDAALRRRRAS
ncbi:hypothetical protein [Canibacter zhoujuaniae]|uniref:hypothetical protein n=1 Tax=Canibacter zhoujuaniae TaxID=2708343 RepID=UPI001422AECF|nr:hypothetical protein [Canibacter zhoujuaniae]